MNKSERIDILQQLIQHCEDDREQLRKDHAKIEVRLHTNQQHLEILNGQLKELGK